jgi:hypothetical protein
MELHNRAKTAALAEERRAWEMSQRVEQARMKAVQEALAEEQRMAAEAYGDPEAQARYEAWLDQYRNNPQFRKTVEDARMGRAMAAEREELTKYQTMEALQAEVQATANAVYSIGQKYPTVDPEMARERYAQALQLDQLPLSEDAIEYVYQTLQQEATRYTQPLRSELDGIRAELAQLKQREAAMAHNAQTRAAVSRATQPIGAPLGGAPVSPAAQAVTLNGKTLADRSREWARLK